MKKVRLGMTMGDPSGIGPAIIAKAAAKIGRRARVTVIGDAWVLEKAAGNRFSTPRVENPSGAGSSFSLVDLANVPRKNFSFGKVRYAYGRASLEYLDTAVRLLKERRIDCLVTCPVSKEAAGKAGFSFPGHTEYLAHAFGARDTVMMLLNRRLRIALATTHLPLRRVARALTAARICRTLKVTTEHLKALWHISRPRIAVCGLNPHASDAGRFGSEEGRVITPAILRARRLLKNTCIEGPFPADAALHRAYRGEYDCAVAMYHDQALIPLKLLENAAGVNMTLGLPFARTSPLHGT
ncbi:MAG: 4-hydroxythreonine-4-phosphate dehydrogenase PdxA, partial [Candidatus Omnitrophica bacterium]|nr:4-hydroxythreonine-4-phosphate dehydrogenase PdxA [Candidatus Omnitrophota bacterium]